MTPLLGHSLIKVKPGPGGPSHDIYDTPFYRWLRRLVTRCLTYRWRVIGATAFCFVGAVFLMGLVKQEFFPNSTRPEISVNLRLPQGASLEATEAEALRFARHFDDDSHVARYSYYMGEGAPRFVLTAEPTLPDTNFAQFVIVAKNLKARDEVETKIRRILATDFPNVISNVKFIQLRPPEPYPVMLRVVGYDHEKVREIAIQVRDVMDADKSLLNANLDWNEKSKSCMWPSIRTRQGH